MCKFYFIVTLLFSIFACSFHKLRLNNYSSSVKDYPTSFDLHKDYRDVHGHNITWDTLTGVWYMEYASFLPDSVQCSNKEKYFCGDVCKSIFYVTDNLQRIPFIDTLNILKGDLSKIDIDTTCSYLKKQRLLVDSLIEKIHQKYPNYDKYNIYNNCHWTSGDLFDCNTNIYTTSEPLISEKPRIAIVLNVKMIAKIYWNIDYNPYRNKETTAAFKACPECCWFNEDSPPKDFVNPIYFESIQQIDSTQQKLFNLTSSMVNIIQLDDLKHGNKLDYDKENLPLYKK